MRTIVATVAALLLFVAVSGAFASSHDNCDFTAATDVCEKLITGSRCDYFKCLVHHCPTSVMMDIARHWCGMKNNSNTEPNKPLIAGGRAGLLRESKPRHRDGSDLKAKDSLTKAHVESQLSEEQANVERVLEAKRVSHGVHKKLLKLPRDASPCHDSPSGWSVTKAQQFIHHAAWAGYLDRAHEHYTEGAQRWSGIDGHVCPGKAPEYSDCSAFVTWIYWTVFGKGPDFLNDEDWKAGYTGTLVQHGVNVDIDKLEVGDLCFYYTPMSHVAIYVGGGKVVSHGADPVGYYPVKYAPLDYCRRYL